VVAQLEGGALGGLAIADVLPGAANLDFIERAQAGAAGMVGTGIDRALNAGVSIDIALHT